MPTHARQRRPFRGSPQKSRRKRRYCAFVALFFSLVGSQLILFVMTHSLSMKDILENHATTTQETTTASNHHNASTHYEFSQVWPTLQKQFCPNMEPNVEFAELLFDLAYEQLLLEKQPKSTSENAAPTMPSKRVPSLTAIEFFEGDFFGMATYRPPNRNHTLVYIPLWQAKSDAIINYIKTHLYEAYGGEFTPDYDFADWSSLSNPCFVTAVRDPISRFMAGYQQLENHNMEGGDDWISTYSDMDSFYGQFPTGSSERFSQFIVDLLNGREDMASEFDNIYNVYPMIRTLASLARLRKRKDENPVTVSYLKTTTNLSNTFPIFLKQECPGSLPTEFEPLPIDDVPMESDDEHGFRKAANSVWNQNGHVSKALCILHALDYACWRDLPGGIPQICKDTFSSNYFVRAVKEEITGEREEKNQAPVLHSPPPLAIFYNIFIPYGEKRVQNLISIMDEQFDQIGRALTLQHRKSIPVYYNTIGKKKTRAAMNAIHRKCAEYNQLIECVHTQHVAKGDEKIALQGILDFCQQDEHKHHRVTYLHPKGSFHPSWQQDAWRSSLTQSALVSECVNPPNNTCNMCGVMFLPQFTPFIPGNMWTASCDYIKKLPPLKVHEKMLEKSMGDALLMKARDQMLMNLYRDDSTQASRYGLGRYAAEHWHGSHPDIVPCDVGAVAIRRFVDMRRNAIRYNQFEFRMAPHTTGELGGPYRLRNEILHKAHLRLREYFFLPGLLHKWWNFYDQAPPANSWVWEWYPDGAFWKNETLLHGAKAVEIVTSPYYEGGGTSRALSDPIPVRSSLSAQQDAARRPILTTNNDAHLVVFYQSWHGAPAGTQQLTNEQLRAMNSQMSSQNATAELIVDIIEGSNMTFGKVLSENFVGKICKSYSNLKCHAGQQWLPTEHGETLSSLHAYCQANPSKIAAFVHNNWNEMNTTLDVLSKSSPALLWHLSNAATSTRCLTGLKSSLYNVCSLIYSSLFTFELLENIFVARCDYIAKLLPPKVFEKRIINAARNIVLAEARKEVTTLLPLGKSKIEKLGIDRYSIRHWVGSHPDFCPCQLASTEQQLTNLTTNQSTDEYSTSSSQFTGVFPPIHTLAFSVLGEEEKNRTLEILEGLNSKSVLESGLLAGQLLKWFELYGKAPNETSWHWDWFPDGEMWKKAVADYGNETVHIVTSEWMDEH